MGVISCTKAKMNYSKLRGTSPNVSGNVSNSGIDGAWKDKDKPTLEGFEFMGFTVSADMVEAILELDEERKNKNE